METVLDLYQNQSHQNQSMMRADLSGGVLDIWPLYLILQNCVTVQFSLKLYSKAQLHIFPHTSEVQIKIHNTQQPDKQLSDKISPDKKKKQIQTFSFQSHTDFLADKNHQLSLIQAFVRYFNINHGFQIEISSESPVGGGLGASSSLSVSLLKCFSSAMNIHFNFIDSIRLCCDLEAQVLKTPAGIQDYIVPLQKKDYPWINIIELNPLKPKVQSIPLPKDILKQHLLLIDSRISHHSGQTNWHIIQNALNGKNLNELRQCRDISLEMAQSCRTNKFENWPYLFEKEYQYRKQIQTSIPQKAEELKKYLCSQGAQGVKFMGAGNGGCLLVWTEKKDKLKQTCLQEGLYILEDFL